MSAPPRGLPEHLPAGERLVWQGAPDWRVLARRAFHIRKLAAYFAIIVAWVGASAVSGGAPLGEAALSTLQAAGFAAVPLGVIAGYSWLVARGTVYTMTDRRLVMRVGIGLPVTINLPFSRVGAAAVNRRADGSGDISLSLTGPGGLAYLVLWPHARPWRLGRAEPMLRGLPDVVPVAQQLARMLAVSADMPVPVLHGEAVSGTPVPHATMAA